MQPQTLPGGDLHADGDRGRNRRRKGCGFAESHRGDRDRHNAPRLSADRRRAGEVGSENRDTADHSLPYVTARAMFDGDITNESFAPHMYRDPRILAFMQKIKVSEDPILTARVGAAVPTRMTAILSDGQRISREVDYAPGFAAR